MKKRNTRKEKKNVVKRERDPIPWRYCLLALFCGLLLATGFFWAARQHFVALDYGMKNARLRDDIKSLKEEQGRLSDERENARNSSEIKKLAKKLGFRDLTVENTATAAMPKEKTEGGSPKQPEKNESILKVKKTEEVKSEEKNSKHKSGNIRKNEARPQIAKK